MDNFEEVEYSQILRQNHIDYAMSTIVARAIPSVKDGLKPVQRRILYTMSTLSPSDKPHRKCARIVGDVMGKYHPHGDSSIYEALVKLSQDWFSQRVLIDGHGNFGSIDGDGAAAMRYTEARLSKYAEDCCLSELPYYSDDFVENFDNTEREPTVLPWLIPNLLVNGSSGIAVGLATDIPPHNFSEVCNMTIKYLETGRKASLDELLEIMPAPDFPTGGIINATKEELRQIYETGRGKIKVRGKVEIENLGFGRKSICVTEIPFGMINNTHAYLVSVAELYRNRILPGCICEIADRGSKLGTKYCVDVKKGTTDEEINQILGVLYKKTALEGNYSCNITAINSDNNPETMGLLRIMEEFCAFKDYLYQVKYEKLLEREEKKAEINEGLLLAVDMIDAIIATIRGCKSSSDAKNALMTGEVKGITYKYKELEKVAKTFAFTEVQAEAILNMRLQRLIGLEILSLQKALDESKKKIKQYQKLLSSPKDMVKQMIADIRKLEEAYHTERKCEVRVCEEIAVEETKEPAVKACVLLDRFYYLKAIDYSVYEKNKEQIDKDYRFAIPCMSDGRISLFADNSQVYTVKVEELIKQQAKKVPAKSAKKGKFSERASSIGKLSDKGVQMFELCTMNGDENILYASCTEVIASGSVVFVTKDGNARKVLGTAYDTARKVMQASKPEEEMVYIGLLDDFIVLKTKDGYYARMQSEEIVERTKAAGSSKLLALGKGDFVESALCGKIKDDFACGGKNIPFGKIKLFKKGNKGVKMRV